MRIHKIPQTKQELVKKYEHDLSLPPKIAKQCVEHTKIPNTSLTEKMQFLAEKLHRRATWLMTHLHI